MEFENVVVWSPQKYRRCLHRALDKMPCTAPIADAEVFCDEHRTARRRPDPDEIRYTLTKAGQAALAGARLAC